jgi:hypothetical protein
MLLPKGTVNHADCYYTTPPSEAECAGVIGKTAGNGARNATVEDVTVEAVRKKTAGILFLSFLIAVCETRSFVKTGSRQTSRGQEVYLCFLRPRRPRCSS